MRALLAAAMLAASGAWASAPRPDVRFSAVPGGGYEIEGAFEAAAPPATAWAVLTDYDHLSRFVSSLKESRVVRQTPSLIVEQKSDARFWIFHRGVRVLLAVVEQPLTAIRFSDLSRADFSSYDGSWSLQEIPGGTRVVYRLKAKGGLGAPRRLAAGAARRTVTGLLEQVRAEMERRAPQS